MESESKNMETIPQHHIRRDVCTTRPAYRQGRHLKAVKVYTINQESKHILIHGVQAVGAGNELSKVCQMFGEVEEMKPLDDYPSEAYTEVYWVKYRKTQSARFAKKHLDDVSMFGGVLHVCYAPEYETVDETREKLQERRKIIAAKTRAMSDTTDVLSITNTSLGSSSERHTSAESDADQTTRLSVTSDCPAHPGTSEFIDESVAPTRGQTYSCPAAPPSPLVFSQNIRQSGREAVRFKYHRVPSSHATLPPGYDGRLDPPQHPTPYRPNIQKDGSQVIQMGNTSRRPFNIGDATKQWNAMYEYKPAESGTEAEKETEIDVNEDDKTIVASNAKEVVDCLQEQDKLDLIQGEVIRMKSKSTTLTLASQDNGDRKVEKLIVRKYKPKVTSAPRFVPRQVVKKEDSNVEYDSVDAALRKNAFHLHETKGPMLPPDFEKSEVKTRLDDSVQNTVKEIRNKMEQIYQTSRNTLEPTSSKKPKMNNTETSYKN